MDMIAKKIIVIILVVFWVHISCFAKKWEWSVENQFKPYHFFMAQRKPKFYQRTPNRHKIPIWVSNGSANVKYDAANIAMNDFFMPDVSDLNELPYASPLAQSEFEKRNSSEYHKELVDPFSVYPNEDFEYLFFLNLPPQNTQRKKHLGQFKAEIHYKPVFALKVEQSCTSTLDQLNISEALDSFQKLAKAEQEARRLDASLLRKFNTEFFDETHRLEQELIGLSFSPLVARQRLEAQLGVLKSSKGRKSAKVKPGTAQAAKHSFSSTRWSSATSFKSARKLFHKRSDNANEYAELPPRGMPSTRVNPYASQNRQRSRASTSNKKRSGARKGHERLEKLQKSLSTDVPSSKALTGKFTVLEDTHKSDYGILRDVANLRTRFVAPADVFENITSETGSNQPISPSQIEPNDLVITSSSPSTHLDDMNTTMFYYDCEQVLLRDGKEKDASSEVRKSRKQTRLHRPKLQYCIASGKGYERGLDLHSPPESEQNLKISAATGPLQLKRERQKLDPDEIDSRFNSSGPHQSYFKRLRSSGIKAELEEYSALHFWQPEMIGNACNNFMTANSLFVSNQLYKVVRVCSNNKLAPFERRQLRKSLMALTTVKRFSVLEKELQVRLWWQKEFKFSTNCYSMAFRVEDAVDGVELIKSCLFCRRELSRTFAQFLKKDHVLDLKVSFIRKTDLEPDSVGIWKQFQEWLARRPGKEDKILVEQLRHSSSFTRKIKGYVTKFVHHAWESSMQTAQVGLEEQVRVLNREDRDAFDGESSAETAEVPQKEMRRALALLGAETVRAFCNYVLSPFMPSYLRDYSQIDYSDDEDGPSRADSSSSAAQSVQEQDVNDIEQMSLFEFREKMLPRQTFASLSMSPKCFKKRTVRLVECQPDGRCIDKPEFTIAELVHGPRTEILESWWIRKPREYFHEYAVASQPILKSFRDRYQVVATGVNREGYIDDQRRVYDSRTVKEKNKLSWIKTKAYVRGTPFWAKKFVQTDAKRRIHAIYYERFRSKFFFWCPSRWFIAAGDSRYSISHQLLNMYLVDNELVR